jgi:xanthine dehydrogenase molybdopterin-binding subunit B
VQNVAARNRVVLTNRLPSGLNRGFGGPQLYFALERTMAIAARTYRTGEHDRHQELQDPVTDVQLDDPMIV